MASYLKLIVVHGAIISSMLLVPLVAMQFTSEVKWTSEDFLAMAILLVAASCTRIVLIRVLYTRGLNSKKVRALVTLAVISVFFLVWLALAVGIGGNL